MRAITLATIVASIVVAAGTAQAARFQVQPTQVALSGEHHTGSVTITNRSDRAVRFQVKAMAWDEAEDGAMKLVPSDDLVVYPTLFTVDAGASRSVRVAAAAAPAARETSYRIFVEELPPLRRSDDPTPARITMLTRMGIPVFLPPRAPRFDGVVTAELHGGNLGVRLLNRGTVHVRVASVRVIGDRGGVVSFDRTQTGWYLLAGRARRYPLALSAADCARLGRVRVEVVTDHGTWRTTVAVAAGTCDGVR